MVGCGVCGCVGWGCSVDVVACFELFMQRNAI